jgi:hypothetical protein
MFDHLRATLHQQHTAVQLVHTEAEALYRAREVRELYDEEAQERCEEGEMRAEER